MKHTKKLLKQVFGKKKDGIRFIQNMMQREKSNPSLFVYAEDGSSAGSDFLDWLATMASAHSAIVHEHDFHADLGHSDLHANVLVDGVHEVSDPLIEKVVRTRSKRKRIVVASKRRPKALDYVSDPTLIVAGLEEFDLAKAKSEIPDFLNKIS